MTSSVIVRVQLAANTSRYYLVKITTMCTMSIAVHFQCQISYIMLKITYFIYSIGTQVTQEVEMQS